MTVVELEELEHSGPKRHCAGLPSRAGHRAPGHQVPQRAADALPGGAGFGFFLSGDFGLAFLKPRWVGVYGGHHFWAVFEETANACSAGLVSFRFAWLGGFEVLILSLLFYYFCGLGVRCSGLEF